MKKEDFLKAGYKECEAGVHSDWAEYVLQKTIKDGKETCYSIEAYYSTISGEDQFVIKVQFYRNVDIFDLEIHCRTDRTVNHVEKFLQRFYELNDMTTQEMHERFKQKPIKHREHVYYGFLRDS